MSWVHTHPTTVVAAWAGTHLTDVTGVCCCTPLISQTAHIKLSMGHGENSRIHACRCRSSYTPPPSPFFHCSLTCCRNAQINDSVCGKHCIPIAMQHGVTTPSGKLLNIKTVNTHVHWKTVVVLFACMRQRAANIQPESKPVMHHCWCTKVATSKRIMSRLEFTEYLTNSHLCSHKIY